MQDNNNIDPKVTEMIEKLAKKKGKPTMSVREMGRMLGLQKTDSYWLVNKRFFKTVQINGKTRVDMESFNRWYDSQVKYQIVGGRPPGSLLRELSFSPREMAEELGVSEAYVYEIIEMNNIPVTTVDYLKRVMKKDFYAWYQSQTHFRTKADREKDAGLERDSMTMPEMARLLGVPCSEVYRILSLKKNRGIFEIITVGDKKRITKESFEKWYAGQSQYKKDIGSFIIPQCRTLEDLLREYVALYGKNTWALSTYESNIRLIDNYILPYLGGVKLQDLTPRVMEKYYQTMLKTEAVPRKRFGWNEEKNSELISVHTVQDIHKLLRNCFGQAVKWELMEKNPCINATIPKAKPAKREIWDAETLFHAIEICQDERLKLALNLAFSCTLRIGELLGLTWDCVDISPSSIEAGEAHIQVNKELQRVHKKALADLEGKDVVFTFPAAKKRQTTTLVLKTPKTISSVRHTSITYKLKLNGGDIKSVQGDSGHSQAKMVTDQYSHILDEDRKSNARIFEQYFYSGHKEEVPEEKKNDAKADGDLGPEDLLRILQNPEMAALLKTLAKAMDK